MSKEQPVSNVQINAPIQVGCLVEKVTDSRALNTTYYNTYKMPKTCLVSVGVLLNYESGWAFAYISPEPGFEIAYRVRVGMAYCQRYNTSVHLYDTLSFTVPSGWFYRVYGYQDLILFEWVEESLYAARQ